MGDSPGQSQCLESFVLCLSDTRSCAVKKTLKVLFLNEHRKKTGVQSATKFEVYQQSFGGQYW